MFSKFYKVHSAPIDFNYIYSEDAELYDYIKDEVGFRLSDRVFDVKRQFKNAVDLGCGRGYISKHIMADSVERITLCDLSPTMLSQAECTPGVDVIRKEMDEEVFQVRA